MTGRLRALLGALLALQLLAAAHARENTGGAAANPSPASADQGLLQQFTAVTDGLDADVQQTLADIEGLPRRLLALRSYLRAGDALRTRWSWTEAEITEFRRSPRHQQVLTDTQRLTAQFETLNPGFTLYVNTEIRSLGVQLERWNKNRSVGLLADQLLEAARRALPQDTAASGDALRQFLIAWVPPSAAPLAAPGLSAHGRGRALDFQVRKGDRIIAGTEVVSVQSVWDASGWARKLQLAVEKSGLPFRGPLEIPREPWHYEYLPPDPADR